jgi:hypothetical protein
MSKQVVSTIHCFQGQQISHRCHASRQKYPQLVAFFLNIFLNLPLGLSLALVRDLFRYLFLHFFLDLLLHLFLYQLLHLSLGPMLGLFLGLFLELVHILAECGQAALGTYAEIVVAVRKHSVSWEVRWVTGAVDDFPLVVDGVVVAGVDAYS